MTKKLPLVSIVVPIYNVEKYLRQCLDSLISQTLQDIEIICVNDASPDNSLAILKEYEAKDKRIVVIDLKENLCQGGARNKGIEKARASYIAFVDSDDWVAHDMYEKLYMSAVENDADIVFSNYWAYRNDDDIRECVGVKDSSLFELSEDVINKELILNGFFVWNNLYKKDLFTLNNLYFPEHTFYEDTAIIQVLFCLACHKSYVNIPLYYYRQNNNSISRKKDDLRFYQRLDTAIMFVENMKRFGLYDKYKDEIDYNFIINYYDMPIWGSLFYFSRPQLNRIIQVKKSMQEHQIDLNNIYYLKQTLSIRRMVVKMINYNSYLTIPLFYICSFFRKLRDVFKYK